MATILLVDDEQNLVDLLRGTLQREGYDVLEALDGRAALAMAREHDVDLVVLDVMLPDIDGIEVCRQLRQFSDAYVVMLTARVEEIDKIVGLSVGADDYVTKPFSPREVAARVRALLRRPRLSQMTNVQTGTDEPTPHIFGELVIDETRHEAVLAGQILSLTVREFSLLLVLASHPGRVFTRLQLLEAIWGDEYYDDHVVDVHVANLRRKLADDPAQPRFIETVRGVGYRFGPRSS
ncbi:MAG: response regulator transcription factor [Chloroflexi bacterium]|nr:response regulator transcription factor [Chloroflexota bacterium]